MGQLLDCLGIRKPGGMKERERERERGREGDEDEGEGLKDSAGTGEVGLVLLQLEGISVSCQWRKSSG